LKKLSQDHCKAKDLREQGHSIKFIAKQLNRPQSSISYWVKNVQLTKEQKDYLKSINPALNEKLRNSARRFAVERIKIHYMELRKRDQLKGSLLAKEQNPRFIAGIMLYWAEGSKDKNSIKFCNSNVHMVIFFIKFLKEFFKIKDNEIILSINCHLNNGLNINDIQKFWMKQLNLPISNFRKTTIADNRITTGFRKNKHAYGVCSVSVHRTDLIQKIYGAIQEFIGFNDIKLLG
jgi:hypothetical protein